MKRSKKTIINRRIMHRYQQMYRLWHRYWLHFPILKIRPYDVEWNAEEWLKYGGYGGVLFFEEKGEKI